MDTKALFQKVSEKMRTDFDIAAHTNHKGSRGTVLENILRNFLAEGRLPPKYGLGAGEIVGRVRDTSRQCDVIVYDKFNGLTLLYDDQVQIFPIDCIYGIIEVKSSLSKTELIDSLEKIKAFKEMSPTGTVSQPINNAFTMSHARPKPFGVVFAYKLSSNSLNSLTKNLQEWEATNPPNLWPNYICVLEEGVIYHQGKGFSDCLDSHQITSASWPLAMTYKQDSLFKFYCAVHDMCAHMHLGPVELNHYYDPAIKIGKFIVYGRAAEVQLLKDGEQPRPAKLKESAIEKIVSWCSTREKIQYADVLKKRVGSIPLGMDENSESMRAKVHLYNPDNLPGLDDLKRQSAQDLDKIISKGTLLNTFDLFINNEYYVIAVMSLTHEDYQYTDG